MKTVFFFFVWCNDIQCAIINSFEMSHWIRSNIFFFFDNQSETIFAEKKKTNSLKLLKLYCYFLFTLQPKVVGRPSVCCYRTYSFSWVRLFSNLVVPRNHTKSTMPIEIKNFSDIESGQRVWDYITFHDEWNVSSSN